MNKAEQKRPTCSTSRGLLSRVKGVTRQCMGNKIRFKHQYQKSELLDSPKGFEKYLVQCVVCQEIGYDPDQLKLRTNKHFQKRPRDNFNPLKVNDIGICEQCQRHTGI